MPPAGVTATTGSGFTVTVPTEEIFDKLEVVHVEVHQKYVVAERVGVVYVASVAPGITVPGGVLVAEDDHW